MKAGVFLYLRYIPILLNVLSLFLSLSFFTYVIN